MITLHAFGNVHRTVFGETRDLRVQWALEETGLPYTVHGWDHSAGELDGEAFARIGPFQQLPVLEDDGLVLAETGAILLYLAEKSGRLVPADFEGRMRVTQWCFAALSTIELPLAELQMMGKRGAEQAPERHAALVKWAQRVLGNVERRLEGREWIACDTFTVADILLTSVLREIRKTDLMQPYPQVGAFFARAQARPAWQRTLALYAERLGADLERIR